MTLNGIGPVLIATWIDFEISFTFCPLSTKPSRSSLPLTCTASLPLLQRWRSPLPAPKTQIETNAGKPLIATEDVVPGLGMDISSTWMMTLLKLAAFPGAPPYGRQPGPLHLLILNKPFDIALKYLAL